MDGLNNQNTTAEQADAGTDQGGTAARKVPPYIPPKKRGNGFQRTALLTAGAVVVILILIAFFRSAGGSDAASAVGSMIRTATVERRDFVRSLRLHGTVEAVQSFAVMAPRLAGAGGGPMVITKLALPGAMVHQGDLLVEFDRQNQVKNALDRQAEYRDFEEQIKRRRAEQDAALAKDQTELKQAENALSTAEVEMKRNEVISKIDAEKNQQNLEEARAKLMQLRATFALKRTAVTASLRVLEIQRDRSRGAMEHAEKNAEKMAIHAPLAGMVVLNTIWKGGSMGEIAEGDEIRPGVPFMQVVNPAAMQARARVNQADVPDLQKGQPAQVRLDAYPGLEFPGRVEALAAIGVTSGLSNKVRTFAATFSIQGSDPRLLPDLSAGVDVEFQRVPNALIVPRDSVWTEKGQSYVQVRTGSGFEKRAVKTGPTSDAEVVIESGLEQGLVVARGSSAFSSGSQEK